MSELQNHIIQQLASREGEQRLLQRYNRHNHLLRAAIELYYASGGNAEDLHELIQAHMPRKTTDIPEAIARMVVETAAVSHASDLDVV
jgi:hypothetical protein